MANIALALGMLSRNAARQKLLSKQSCAARSHWLYASGFASMRPNACHKPTEFVYSAVSKCFKRQKYEYSAVIIGQPAISLASEHG